MLVNVKMVLDHVIFSHSYISQPSFVSYQFFGPTEVKIWLASCRVPYPQTSICHCEQPREPRTRQVTWQVLGSQSLPDNACRKFSKLGGGIPLLSRENVRASNGPLSSIIELQWFVSWNF